MTAISTASDQDFPSVYAAPTEWNEHLISALSSMLFRRSHRPEFARAVKERLMHSVEVQNPTLATNAKPILLVVLTSDGNSSFMDCFREAVEQSTAFMVIHQRIDPRQTTRRQYENVASICKMSGLPTFLVISSCLSAEARLESDLSYFWNQLCSDWFSRPTHTGCLKGIISISTVDFGAVQEMERICPIPHLKVTLGFFQDQRSGGLHYHYLTNQNASVIFLRLPRCQSNTCSLWLARLLFKYIFAVLQLSKYESMMTTGNPKARI